jgi:selenocysteine-specific elongation factor
MITVAGGVVLDPWAPKHRRRRPDVLRGLEVREGGRGASIAAEVVRAAGTAGLQPDDRALVAALALPGDSPELRAAIDLAEGEGLLRRLPGGHLLASLYLDRALELLGKLLGRYHREHPLRAGLPRGEAVSRLASDQRGLPAEAVLAHAVESGGVVARRDRVADPGFRVLFSEQEEALRSRILEEFGGNARFTPPSPEQVLAGTLTTERDAARRVIHALLDGGELVRLRDDLVFRADALAALEQGIVEMTREQDRIGVAEIKARFGCSRKYSIPLLEHTDRKGLTRREGDSRVAGTVATN